MKATTGQDSLLTRSDLVNANLENSQLFAFYEAYEDLVESILFCLARSSSSTSNPMDFHYLLGLMQYSALNQREQYEVALKEIAASTKDVSSENQLNALVNRLSANLITKRTDLIRWNKQI